ncbi:MAG: hypothetical protein U0975_05750 [Erythrobacter sp.]|nr:hypothetical protein [Erythrobacter sp.]MDZ4272161.1 hypothetical protein [Erythrobacter sp.]
MKIRYYLSIFVLLMLWGCKDASHRDEIEELKSEIEILNDRVDLLETAATTTSTAPNIEQSHNQLTARERLGPSPEEFDAMKRDEQIEKLQREVNRMENQQNLDRSLESLRQLERDRCDRNRSAGLPC